MTSRDLNYKILLLLGSFLLLVLLSTQYPLYTTFPIGGDASYYIAIAQTVLSHAISSPLTSLSTIIHSNYPLFHISFLPATLLPTDWPNKFTWWMSIGHILSGISLGFFLYRLRGTKTAIIGISIWALATTSVNNHFEDGTLAQLWSIIPMLIFFERVSSAKPIASFIALLAALATHPITGLLSILTIFFTMPTVLTRWNFLKTPQKKIVVMLSFASLALIVVGTIMLINKNSIFLLPNIENSKVFIIDLIHSHIGPFILLSPIGFFWMLQQIHRRPLTIALTTMFVLLSTILAFNDHLGVYLWPHRFQSYFIVSITICSAIALSILTSSIFRSKPLQYLFLLILFATISPIAWNQNSKVYAAYESPSRYLRLHPSEIEGIIWLNTIPSDNSLVYSSNKTRHAEWVPVLTKHKWVPIDSIINFNNIFDQNDQSERRQKIYLILFNKVEKPPESIPSFAENFEILFSNEGTNIYKLVE